MASFKVFLDELRRRKVIRVAIVYAVVAWLMMQIAEVSFEPLNLPDWARSFVVFLLVLGFPLALVLAWAYELTPEGVKRDADARGAEPAREDPPSTASTTGGATSIAVLPFADMSENKDQEYFCDGVAEEILNTLTNVGTLDVASRTSSFRFRGDAADISAIGRDLNVDTILEGSVRKSGDKLRITAQLINVADGYQLWSARYDSEMRDIFQIQDEIARSIAIALQVTLGSEALAAPTSDVQAYDNYLRGRNFFYRFGPKNLGFARQMFSKAIEIDPDYAMAWAGLADAHAFEYLYFGAPEDHLEQADQASMRALEIAPDLAETHASRGLAHMLSKEYREAEGHFEKAIHLNEDLFEAYYFYARTRFHQGELEHAAELFEKASEVRPDDYQSQAILTGLYNGLGQPDREHDAAQRSVAIIEQLLEFNPDDARALYLGAGCLLVLGDRERAAQRAQRAIAIDPEDGAILYNVACYYSNAGELDKAIELLEKVNLPGMANKSWMQNDPDLEPLRGDPRFQAVLDSLRG